MKTIVFGATGAVGSEVVKSALKKGHEVTAFVRKPNSENSNPNLSFFVGDVFNLEDVTQAVKGHDAVICVLGDGRIGKVRAAGTRNILEAMNRNSVNRLICQTTLGMGESYENLNFFWKKIMFGWFLKEAFQDHIVQEKLLFESGLDFTIVRPSALVDNVFDKPFQVGFGPNQQNLSLKISKKETADFITDQLESDALSRRAVSISH